MKFWDSSALVPLVIKETSTAPLVDLFAKDGSALVWWGSEVECASALARLEREGCLSNPDANRAFERLMSLSALWHSIEPGGGLRLTARRFLRVHPLRAADALQLAAAFLASESQPSTLGFVCLDQRLTVAARKEGFSVFELEALASN